MTVSTHTETVSDAAVQAASLAVNIGHRDFEIPQRVLKLALTAALPHLALSSAPCSVEAKKLSEWRRGYCDECVTIEQASTGLGSIYQVRVLNGVVWLDFPDERTIEFKTCEAAKAAAQADFERRILSQIVTKPVDVAAVRGQAFEEITAIVTRQKEYWGNKQKGLRSLEDAYDKDGELTPLGDDEAWQAGSANGHYSEACWLIKTIRSLSPAEPAQGGQWQDIATAPKDGTFFITVNTGEIERWHTFKDDEVITVKANDRPFMCSSFSDEDGTPLFMDDFGEAYTLDGIVIDADELTAADNVLRLTHWMPLPAAPNLSAGRTTEGGEV